MERNPGVREVTCEYTQMGGIVRGINQGPGNERVLTFNRLQFLVGITGRVVHRLISVFYVRPTYLPT